MRKNLLLLLLSFMSITYCLAQNNQLTSFESLMKALNAGKNVRVIMHYAKCKQIADNEEKEKAPDAVGGMNLDTYEYFEANAAHNKDPFVVASTSKLIGNPKGDGFVFNYVKIKVSPDNKVKVTAQYVDVKTMEITMDENFFGEINNGENDGGIFFFTTD